MDKKQTTSKLAKNRALRIGGYSMLISLAVIAAAVIINLLINALPAAYTKFDTSSSQFFTLSDKTKEIVSGLDSDDGEDSRDSVAGEDADDERDELNHLLAEDGAEHCHEESDETADDSDIDACGRLAVDCIGAFLEVAYSVACERKSDYSDGGSDNGGGHELIDPADTGNLDSYCYNNIDETREHSAENQSEIAERNGGSACESGCH